MQTTLVVVRAFGPHAVGDRIVEPDAIAGTLASDHAGSVVAVQAAAPAPAPAAKGER